MKIQNKVGRTLYAVAAFLLVVTGISSGFIGHASANQVTARSITISNSNGGTNNVAYTLAFTTATTSNVGGIVVDFCSNDPIIGDSCTAPAGFDVNKSTTTIGTQVGITGNSIDTTNSTANKLILTRTASSISTGTAVSIPLGDGSTTGFHNPTAIGSYFARIYTYATTAAAQGHSTNSPSGYVDYGGIALSTAAVINITAKVQETLSFCVYKTACGDDPSFTLGHAVGTATVIDSTAVDTQPANFSISTNANGGVVVRMKGDTLKSGSNTIAAAGSSAATITAGTAAFGARVSTSGTNITPTAPYNNGSGTQYGLDITTSNTPNTNVTSTYGGQIATLSGPTTASVSTVTFAATASATTPAGTYTAAEQLIATGTF